MINRLGWRNHLRNGVILRLSKQSNSRVGNCWMAGRIIDGDLALNLGASGDCFHNYALLRQGSPTRWKDTGLFVSEYSIIEGGLFGAYEGVGIAYEFQPTNREMHLLMAGEYVQLESEAQARIARARIMNLKETT
jgi:hypothetical protein